MSNISSLTFCGRQNQSGTNATIRIACVCDFPDEEDVVTDSLGVSISTMPNVTYATAPIIIDTGQAGFNLVGSIAGAQGTDSMIDFTVLGTKLENLTFAAQLAKASGFLHAAIEMRGAEHKDQHYVVGTKDLPAMLASMNGSTGKANGDLVGTECQIKYSGMLMHYAGSLAPTP